jgi:hypothetical protein
MGKAASRAVSWVTRVRPAAVMIRVGRGACAEFSRYPLWIHAERGNNRGAG